MIIALPMPHSPSRSSDGLAHVGDSNHSGPWMPTHPRTVFTGPVAGLRM
jgi:hypothetical protein